MSAADQDHRMLVHMAGRELVVLERQRRAAERRPVRRFVGVRRRPARYWPAVLLLLAKWTIIAFVVAGPATVLFVSVTR